MVFSSRKQPAPRVVTQSQMVQEKHSQWQRFRTPLVSILSLMALGGMVTLMVKAYPDHANHPDPETVPLVTADASPYRETPEEPGGMDVPFQDSLVLNHQGEDMPETPAPQPEMPEIVQDVTPEAGDDATESVAQQDANEVGDAAPEESIAATFISPFAMPDQVKTDTTETVFAPAPSEDTLIQEETIIASAAVETAEQANALSTSAGDDEAVEAMKDKADEPVQDISKTVPAPEIDVSAPTPEPAPEPVPSDGPIVSAPEPKAEKSVAANPPKQDNIVSAAVMTRIQLGAFREQAKAETEWQRLQKLHGAVLTSAKPDYVRVDLGDKGIFYRLQAVAPSPLVAQNICDAVQSRKGACFIVR